MAKLMNTFASKIHALIAEDVEISRIMLVRLLEFNGITSTQAANGLEAVELLENNEFDVLLLDIQMPYMDGTEVAQRARNIGYDKPIIAVTAASEEEAKSFIEMGFTDVCSKPVDAKSLYQLILKHSDI